MDGAEIYNKLPEELKEGMRQVARCVVFAHGMKAEEAASAFDWLVNWYDCHPEFREE